MIKIRPDVEVARVGAPLLAAVPLAGCRALACYATDVSLHRTARARALRAIAPRRCQRTDATQCNSKLFALTPQ